MVSFKSFNKYEEDNSDKIEFLTKGSFYEKDGKYYCDLPNLNAELLMRMGIPKENVDVIGECTCCHPEKYFSHRYTNGYRGTLLNIICK